MQRNRKLNHFHLHIVFTLGTKEQKKSTKEQKKQIDSVLRKDKPVQYIQTKISEKFKNVQKTIHRKKSQEFLALMNEMLTSEK